MDQMRKLFWLFCSLLVFSGPAYAVSNDNCFNPRGGLGTYAPCLFGLPSYGSGYPGIAATLFSYGSGDVGAAGGAITIPAVANQRVYITGFEVRVIGATVPTDVTLSPLAGSGTLTYAFGGERISALVISFPYPVPATGDNVAVTVTLPAMVGATNATIVVYGFYL